MRNFQLPGRSVVHALNGAASTSHPLASTAAIRALQDGGSAVDAAVAAAAVLGVVEPMSTGIGGDCYALVWRQDQKRIFAIDGAGWAPAGLSVEQIAGQGLTAMPVDGPHSVTIPGAVSAWDRLCAQHGRLGIARALAPAVAIADQGFAVTGRVALDWARSVSLLQQRYDSARLLLCEGRSPLEGERFHLPQLANTLQEIAAGGAEAFYRGDIAKRLVAFLSAQGGVHALSDFAAYEAEWVTPITSAYGGMEVVELPPSGQGITAQLILNILKGFGHDGIDPASARRYHLEIEATRAAFRVRDASIGDPKFSRIPVEELLSDAFAARLRDKISIDCAARDQPALTKPVGDTILVVTADRERNMCVLVNSLFYNFGAGLVCPETGVVLQNRATGFTMMPGHPNVLQPRKRPLNTIIPALVMKNGRPAFGFGVIGAGYQPVGHAHVTINMVDYGMDPQSALDHPRCFQNGGQVDVELGVSDVEMAVLANLGHTVRRPEVPIGSGHMVRIDWERGVLAAAADFRRDGSAIGY